MILYSFIRCPFAIRARLALNYCGLNYEIREVNLKQKPKSLLEYSPKGTVPVLILDDGTIIDESFDIMKWAISTSDENKLSRPNESISIIEDCMKNFLPGVYHCKYPERYDVDPSLAKAKNQEWLKKLEAILEQEFVIDNKISIADLAIFPFIRQWQNIDEDFTKNLKNTTRWLQTITKSEQFKKAMVKQSIWLD